MIYLVWKSPATYRADYTSDCYSIKQVQIIDSDNIMRALYRTDRVYQLHLYMEMLLLHTTAHARTSSLICVPPFVTYKRPCILTYSLEHTYTSHPYPCSHIHTNMSLTLYCMYSPHQPQTHSQTRTHAYTHIHIYRCTKKTYMPAPIQCESSSSV